ncbi:hypothetical protein L3X21_24470, partial [Pseudomonas fragi]|nr:hypothetical protein [Pseudomonas fragi]
MANNTGNPIGSTAAKDLSDNAESLDKFANGTDYEYADRLGRSRKSLKWIEDAALAIPAIDAAMRSEQQAERAIIAKSEAEAARDAAQLSSGVYGDTDEGLVKTPVGSFFSVPSPDSKQYLILYQNVAGTALEVDRYPNSKAIEDIGIEDQSTDVSGLAFAVVDDEGRRTWIEAGKDGRPSAHAAEKIGEVLTVENAPALADGVAAKAVAESIDAVGIEALAALNDLSFAVVDDAGRRTWLEAGKDGKPTQRAIDAIVEKLPGGLGEAPATYQSG